MIHLSVATYSLRGFKRPEAIRIIRELNVHFADVKEMHLPLQDSAQQLEAGVKEFQDAGIRLIAAGNIDLRKPESLRAAFEYANVCGISIIVCTPSLESLPAIEKLVQEFDIKIAINNHGPEDEIFPTPRSCLNAVKDMDPRMGLCIDTGHTARTGADIVESVMEAGPRLHTMHVKDLKDETDKHSQVAIGDGVLPICEVLSQLARQKYAGCCSLEYEIDVADPLPGMQRSMEYMRKAMEEINAA